MSTEKPIHIVHRGIEADSISTIQEGLRAASTPTGKPSPGVLSAAVMRAISSGRMNMLKYLLDVEHAPLDSINPRMISEYATIPLLEILIEHGWNVNQRPPDAGDGPGPMLLQLVCPNDELVRWLLDHGAIVNDGHSDFFNSPPLLETVAAVGSIDTFKLLHSRGAELGRRTLHKAAASATGDGKRQPERMAMVKYLVDDVGLDVNALDTYDKVPGHYGTPLCFVMNFGEHCEEVIRFLLERGADPSIRGCWGENAFTAAERRKTAKIIEMLREWEVKKDGGRKEDWEPAFPH